MVTPMVTIEERVSRLEGTYEQVDRRLEELAASMQALRSEMNSRFNNMYALMGGLWATIVAGIVAIVLTN